MTGRPLRSVVAAALLAGTALAAAAVAYAAGPFKPGVTLKQGAYASFKTPWYVYDRKACRFRTTTKHPATYRYKLRKQGGMRLVYTPEGTQTDFDKTLNDATRKAAASAGMVFYQFSNEYPSTTLPLQVVDQANSVKGDVAISANVNADQYPQIQKKYEQYCIPFLNEYAVPGTKNVPVFQADNYDTGRTMATAAAKIIEQRGWPAKDIWIISCADPAITTKAGTVYDIVRGYRETLVKLLGIPADHVAKPDLVCTFQLGAEGARQATADWLTAHPDAKYVTGSGHIDDVYGLGMANALRNAGFGNRALIAGRGGGATSLKTIASGDPIFAVDGDPRFVDWGPRVVAMAQDIALGLPVPAFASPPVVAVTKANVAKYLKK